MSGEAAAQDQSEAPRTMRARSGALISELVAEIAAAGAREGRAPVREASRVAGVTRR